MATPNNNCAAGCGNDAGICSAPFFRSFVRLTDDAFKKGWHERNGGNLSYRIAPEEVDSIRSYLKKPETWVPIGVSVPDLAGEYFLVTGSGKYFRNVILAPEENLAIAVVDDAGEKYSVLWGLSKGGRPTSEFPSHLMNQAVRKRATNGTNRVIYHAHPNNVIALTFVLPLEATVFTRELWEMMTECPIVFPNGVGVVPWMVPGGGDIARATAKLMEKYSVAVWAHHGMFCSGADFDEAFGLMDTVEKAAEIAVKVRAMGGKKQSILPQEFRDLAKEFGITISEEFLQ